MLVLGAITIIGSLQVGIGWGGRRAAIRLLPVLDRAADRRAGQRRQLRAGAGHPSRKLFAEWGQIAQVLKVVSPMAIYVAAVPWLGIYLASAC